MTVFVYVNTSKQVGDPEQLKVFANQDAAETWFAKTTLKALPSNMRFWSESDRPPDRLCHAGDTSAGHRLAGAGVAVGCKTPQTKIRPRRAGWGRKDKGYALVPRNKMGSAKQNGFGTST
jgi:hypothetical protein